MIKHSHKSPEKEDASSNDLMYRFGILISSEIKD